MTKILAFDPATTTGYAFYDSSRGVSAIRCGVIETSEKAETPPSRRTEA